MFATDMMSMFVFLVLTALRFGVPLLLILLLGTLIQRNQVALR